MYKRQDLVIRTVCSLTERASLEYKIGGGTVKRVPTRWDYQCNTEDVVIVTDVRHKNKENYHKVFFMCTAQNIDGICETFCV